MSWPGGCPTGGPSACRTKFVERRTELRSTGWAFLLISMFRYSLTRTWPPGKTRQWRRRFRSWVSTKKQLCGGPRNRYLRCPQYNGYFSLKTLYEAVTSLANLFRRAHKAVVNRLLARYPLKSRTAHTDSDSVTRNPELVSQIKGPKFGSILCNAVAFTRHGRKVG